MAIFLIDSVTDGRRTRALRFILLVVPSSHWRAIGLLAEMRGDLKAMRG
jgi:hypothetical protein